MLLNANALSLPLADKSVHCVVTSPPYWGLRDYGVSGQLGLEATPEEYVAKMVAVFREVKRVLRDDGTLFLNLGDSYVTNPGNGRGGETVTGGLPHRSGTNKNAGGLKPKDLVGIPWRVAFALQADGWYLRSDIIWHKPNPMPESVTDRPTKAHEYVFLLTKSARYYYDAEAVKEEAVNGDPTSPRGSVAVIGELNSGNRKQDQLGKRQYTGFNLRWDQREERLTHRNRRTVWTIATAPYSGAHFATYPPALVEPCIKAGSPKGGIVLDPFNGSGTTGLVAQQLGRRYVGLDLSFAYLMLARERLGMITLEEWTNGIKASDNHADLPLFSERG